MRVPMRVDPEPVNDAAFEALTEAIETSPAGVPDGLPPDDLQSLQHVEEPRVEPKYDRFMKNERHVREDREVDPETGWRVETWDIGMNRNEKDERKRKMRVFIDPIPHVVLDQTVPLRGWYKNKFEPPNVRPRPCFTDAILTQPYGGYCAVGCAFCYINSGVRGYRGQGVTVVDPSYPDKVAAQLTKMRTGAAVYMSSFIDPFLEVEEFYHNTQRTAWAALQVGLPIFFLTRKQPPGWAFDYLKQSPYSYMQFSINTSSAEDWRKLSPRAVPLETMYANVKAMHDRGIYVSIQVNPIVAGVTSNDDILKLIDDLAACGADHLIFKFVEITYTSVPGMINQIRARFPERADAFAALFVDNIGGVRTIAEEYRLDALPKFMAATKKAGVTMSVCYEYAYARDAEGKVSSKTGVSLGRKFLSGDQCHGHRVPMFSRPTTDVLFTPIEECPNGGCLHCADEFGGETAVPCGNELLARAPALTPQMLNVPADTRRHGGEPMKFLPKLPVLGKI